MVDAWPNTLPQRLLISGASLGEGDGLVEYAPDLGPSLTRRGTTAVMRPLTGNMILTGSQVATWRQFFRTTIVQGSLPFTFPDPLGGSDLLVKHVKGAPPAVAPLGNDNWQLSLSLMVMP